MSTLTDIHSVAIAAARIAPWISCEVRAPMRPGGESFAAHLPP